MNHLRLRRTGKQVQPVNSIQLGTEGESASRRPIRKAYFVGALLGIIASLGLGYLVSWLGSHLTSAGNDASPSALPNQIERNRQAVTPTTSAPAADALGSAPSSPVAQSTTKHANSRVVSSSKRDAKQPDDTGRANAAQSPAKNATRPRPTNVGSVNRWGI